jgi:hypothetical protein
VLSRRNGLGILTHLLDKECLLMFGIEGVCKLPHRNGGLFKEVQIAINFLGDLYE